MREAEYKLSVSFVEVYDDCVRDLLGTEVVEVNIRENALGEVRAAAALPARRQRVAIGATLPLSSLCGSVEVTQCATGIGQMSPIPCSSN